MDIQTDVDKTRKESFFQTPLWYLEDYKWDWLKNSSPSVLKRSLHNPKTLFGIGKIIEMSIYPNITAIYSLKLSDSHQDTSSEDLARYINEDITDIRFSGDRILFFPKETVSPSPEELEVHLRSFWNLNLWLFGPTKIANRLCIEEGEILSYTENLTFEKGLQIEALSQ